MTHGIEFFVVFFTGLLSVMNPLSAVPVWLSLTKDRDEEEKRSTMVKVRRNIFISLVITLLLGGYILSFFGLTIPAIRIAGALLVMNSGLGMVMNRARVPDKALQEDKYRDDISFSPMTMPFFVGPGSMALVLSYADQVGGFWHSWESVLANAILIVCILLATLVAYLALRSSVILQRWMGQSGILAMTKVMGFIVLSVGIQMLLTTVDMLLERYKDFGLSA